MKTEEEIINHVLKYALVCRIGLCLDNLPYVVPLNFGYRDNCLYMHTGSTGKKLDIIRKNNNVCFEMDVDHELIQTGDPCRWSMKYSSIIGYGKAFFVEGYNEKVEALNILTGHYSADENFNYNPEEIEKVTVIKINIDSISARTTYN